MSDDGGFALAHPQRHRNGNHCLVSTPGICARYAVLRPSLVDPLTTGNLERSLRIVRASGLSVMVLIHIEAPLYERSRSRHDWKVSCH